jgi:hypothetical protein
LCHGSQSLVNYTAGPPVSEKYLHIVPKPLQKSTKISENSQISQEPLYFAPRPSNHSTNSRTSLEPPKKTMLPLKAYRAHIFWSKASFFVILAPNSHNSSLFILMHSYITIVCCIVIICLLCALCYKSSCQIRSSRVFRSKSLKRPRFSLAGNKASVLDQLCTYYISVYYVVCRNCMIGVSLRAPMLETIRTLIDYSLVTP